jgi:hypothetical protein
LKVSAAAKIALPSASDFVFVLVLVCLAVIAPAKLLADADTGWHVRAGDWVLKNRAFIRGDIFSYHRAGEPWFAWEWLSDIAMSLANRLAGLHGVVLLTAVVIAGTFRRCFAIVLRNGDDYFGAMALTLLAFGACTVHALARPHVASWYLTILIYSLFVDYQRGKLPRKRLALVVPITVLWVNLHGGFVFGGMLAAIMALSNLGTALIAGRQEARALSLERAKTFTAVLLAMGVSSLASPYGVHLHQHILEYLGNQHFMDTILEFRSPNFHGPDGKCFIALLLVTMVSLARSPLRPEAHELGVLCVCVYSALFAARGVPIAALLMILLAAPHLTAAVRAAAAEDGSLSLRTRSFFRRWTERSEQNLRVQAELRSPLVLLCAVGLVAAMAIQGGRLAGRDVMRAEFDPELFPLAGARDFVAGRPDIDHLFLPDVFSGYLLYYGYPRVRTVMDDRHDFWGDTTVRDYQTLLFVRAGWKEVLDRFDTRFVLLPADGALASALLLTPSWKVIFDDRKAIVFERQPSH